MSYSLRPPEPPSGYFKNPSTTARKNVRSAIPIPKGTVASRVYHLQSLSRATTLDLPSDSNSLPGDSPLGPTKRPNNPFAALFWRKALPDNVQEVEITHSPPESTTSREDSEGVHDPSQHYTVLQNILHTDHKMLDNTKGRIRKRERPFRPPVPKGRSSSGTIKGHNAQRLDGPQEEKELRERLQGHLRGVSGPSRTVQSTRRSPPQRPANFRSESSNTTTSTMRRQSVRELFQDNGIERPAGLASPNNSEDIGQNFHSSKAHVSCHRCAFKNKFVQIACLKCGHHFCDNCPASSIFPHDPFSRKPMRPLSPQKCPGGSSVQSDTPSSSRSSTKRRDSRPHPGTLQRQRIRNGQMQESMPTIGLPSFNQIDALPVSESGKDKRHILSNSKLYENACMNFKDIPRSAMNEVSSSSVNQQSAGISNSMRRPGGSWKPSQEQQPPSDTSPNVAHYNNSMPHDTNDGQPTPMPVTYKHQTVAQGKADICTASADSYVNATSRSNQTDTQDQKMSSYFPNLNSCTRRESTHSPLSNTASGSHYEAAASNNPQQPEYVECHGYPRTEHGNSVELGVIEECRHYLDDCNCLACQRNDHTVRCCINKDHPSIPHIHQVHQAASRLEETAVMSPLVIPPPEIRQLEGQNSPRRSMGRMIPTCQYAVGHVDTVQRKPAKTLASSGTTTNGILKGGLLESINIPKPRENNAMTFNEYMGNSQSEVLAIQPHSGLPVPYNPIPERHASLLSKTITMPSHETLMLQAKQREQKREGSKQIGQKELDNKTESTKKRLAKAERKLLKHAAKLEKNERKMISQKGDKVPEDRTLVLSYEVGQRSKRAERQSTPLSVETRAGQKTPPLFSHDRRDNRSLLTTARSRDLGYHVNIGRRDHLEANSNAAGILGITVIVHMSNAEDLVFKVDASMAESRMA